jgi:hypothetical protein
MGGGFACQRRRLVAMPAGNDGGGRDDGSELHPRRAGRRDDMSELLLPVAVGMAQGTAVEPPLTGPLAGGGERRRRKSNPSRHGWGKRGGWGNATWGRALPVNRWFYSGIFS